MKNATRLAFALLALVFVACEPYTCLRTTDCPSGQTCGIDGRCGYNNQGPDYTVIPGTKDFELSVIFPALRQITRVEGLPNLCMPAGQEPTVFAQARCAASPPKPGFNCQAVIGERLGKPRQFERLDRDGVYLNDLRQGVNHCSGGVVVGPASPIHCRGTLTNGNCGPTFGPQGECWSVVRNGQCVGEMDRAYSCYEIATDEEERCVASSAGLTMFHEYPTAHASSIAGAAGTGWGQVSQGEQFFYQGVTLAQAQAALRYAPTPQGGAQIAELTVETLPFAAWGTMFHDGRVRLKNLGLAAGAAPGGYRVDPYMGLFGFSTIPNGGSLLDAQLANTGALTVSLGAAGPRITGALEGTIAGVLLHIDLDAPLAWENHAPVAVPHVQSVGFSSANLPPCGQGDPDPSPTCGRWYYSGGCGWYGSPAATAKVTLDGSASSDGDGEALAYFWDNDPEPGAIKIVALPHGDHASTLLVIDGAARDVAKVTYSVTDWARCSPKALTSHDLVRLRGILPTHTDPTPMGFGGVSRVPVGEANLALIRSWGERVMAGLGDALAARSEIAQALAGATSTGPVTWPTPPQSP